MRQMVRPGGHIETVTPDEVVKILHSQRRDWEVFRAAESSNPLNANGQGQLDVYQCPAGMEAAVRRVSIYQSPGADPISTQQLLNAAGKFCYYTRNDQFIEYAIPLGPAGQAQIPGLQTWSFEEGPYLRNQEVFGLNINLGSGAAGQTVVIQVQGRLMDHRGKHEGGVA